MGETTNACGCLARLALYGYTCSPARGGDDDGETLVVRRGSDRVDGVWTRHDDRGFWACVHAERDISVRVLERRDGHAYLQRDRYRVLEFLRWLHSSHGFRRRCRNESVCWSRVRNEWNWWVVRHMPGIAGVQRKRSLRRGHVRADRKRLHGRQRVLQFDGGHVGRVRDDGGRRNDLRGIVHDHG